MPITISNSIIELLIRVLGVVKASVSEPYTVTKDCSVEVAQFKQNKPLKGRIWPDDDIKQSDAISAVAFLQ